MRRFSRSLYLFFRSLKLTLALLALIAALSVSATFVPQGREKEYYRDTYGAFGAGLVGAVGFNRVFRSPLFLGLTCAFFVNLAVCTFGTLAARLRSGSGGSPRSLLSHVGFFTLHLGLLVLIGGGVVSLAARKEAGFFLAEGETVRLAYGYTLRLKSFEYLKYSDGRPRAWLSTVEIEREGVATAGAARSFTIAVNRPLKLGRLKIYQSTYGEMLAATLTDEKGFSERILQGRHARHGEAVLFFKGVDATSGKAVFERVEGGRTSGAFEAETGETVDGLRLDGVSRTFFTGLKAVKDPGFLPVVLSFVLVASGISLSFMQKLGEKE
jgi:cytochrome c biogenesis protein